MLTIEVKLQPSEITICPFEHTPLTPLTRFKQIRRLHIAHTTHVLELVEQQFAQLQMSVFRFSFIKFLINV